MCDPLAGTAEHHYRSNRKEGASAAREEKMIDGPIKNDSLESFFWLLQSTHALLDSKKRVGTLQGQALTSVLIQE